MNRRIFLALALLVLATLACSALSVAPNTVVGSGHVISESRTVPSFTGVELQGSADVKVVPGRAQSVVVEADDNIVPLIETTVRSGTLVISNKPNTNIMSPNHIRVTVTMNNPSRVVLGGSGDMNVSGVSGPDLTVELSGSGGVTVTGTADQVTIALPGSGNINCEALRAKSATVTIMGSGTVTVYASVSLDGTIMGSGTIHYAGNPPQVTKHISGSGTIAP